ncbi:hypothetical protein ACX0G9_26905 [Flavitalea flava]
MEWEKKGYLVLRKLIPKDLLKIVADYLVFQSRIGELENDGISKFARYGDSLTEALLLHCLPIAEKQCGKKLFPTYSYARIYQKGDLLKPHQDREACEYSLTIPIDYQAQALWPLYLIKGVGRTRKKIPIRLDKGDLLLYKGCAIIHGRDAFPGTSWTQVFLHYVDAKGQHANWKFDTRKRIGDRWPTSTATVLKKI